MPATITLNNQPIDKISVSPNLYYPRLQTNKWGEIILATHQKNGMTTGILVGRIPDSLSAKLIEFSEPYQIGQKFSDWEVAGELTDYDGEVELIIKNKERSNG